MRECIVTNKKSIVRGYPFTNILYLDTGSITVNKIEKLQEYNISDSPSRAKRLVEEGDIIYSSVRPNQLHYGFIKNPKENLVVSTGFVVISCDQENIEPKYLFYYLSSNDSTEYLHSIAEASTSTYPSLKPSDIESLAIILPPLSEQKAIAEVLSSLDDKIDLLHRQNKTLEQMTETLFRQWFVEEAKDDWVKGFISDFAIHLKSSIHPNKTPESKFYHYSIPAFDSGKYSVNECGGDIKSNKYKIPTNCILFSKLNPHKDKRVWLLQNEVEDNAICSTEFQIIQPKEKIFLYFLYGWLTYAENYNEIASGVGGTSGSHQRINPKFIFNFQCPNVNKDYIEKYNLQVEPVFKKQIINQTQIQTLEKLRDTLLPKLMSGEIRVKDK